MEMASIRAHIGSNTLIISKNSSYTRPITHHINLIIGMNSRCMERIMIDGDLELGKKSEVTGTVRAYNVILGPGTVIYGDLNVQGDLKALDNAKVIGHVAVAGGAFIRPGVMFNSLEASGLIEIQGKPPSKHIKGKMVVNDTRDYREPTLHKGENEIFKKPVPHEEPKILPPKSPIIDPEPAKAKSQARPKETPKKGKSPAAQKKPQGKKKGAQEEKPKRNGLFGLFK
jgi:hypothetical protein